MCQVVDFDPNVTDMGALGSQRTRFVPLDARVFAEYEENWKHIDSLEAAYRMIVDNTIGTELIVSGKGWTDAQLVNAQNELMAFVTEVIKGLMMHGLVVVSVDETTRLPAVLDPSLLRIWASFSIARKDTWYIIRHGVAGAAVDRDRNMINVAVFEAARPDHMGRPTSIMLSLMQELDYRDTIEAGTKTAVQEMSRPTVYLQRTAEKDLTADQFAQLPVAGAGDVAFAAENGPVMRAIARRRYEEETKGGTIKPALYADVRTAAPVHHDSRTGARRPMFTVGPREIELDPGVSVTAGPIPTIPPEAFRVGSVVDTKVSRLTGVPPSMFSVDRLKGQSETVDIFALLQRAGTERLRVDAILDRVLPFCADGVPLEGLCNNPELLRSLNLPMPLDDVAARSRRSKQPKDLSVMNVKTAKQRRDLDTISTPSRKRAHGLPDAAPSTLHMPEGFEKTVMGRILEAMCIGSSDENISLLQLLHEGLKAVHRSDADKTKRVKLGQLTDTGWSTQVARSRVGARDLAGAPRGDDDEEAEAPPPQTRHGKRGPLEVEFSSALDPTTIVDLLQRGLLTFDAAKKLLSAQLHLPIEMFREEDIMAMQQSPPGSGIDELGRGSSQKTNVAGGIGKGDQPRVVTKKPRPGTNRTPAIRTTLKRDH